MRELDKLMRAVRDAWESYQTADQHGNEADAHDAWERYWAALSELDDYNDETADMVGWSQDWQ